MTSAQAWLSVTKKSNVSSPAVAVVLLLVTGPMTSVKAGEQAGGKSIRQPTSWLLLPNLLSLRFPSGSSNGRLQNLKNL